jgi:hypothetical protein
LRARILAYGEEVEKAELLFLPFEERVPRRPLVGGGGAESTTGSGRGPSLRFRSERIEECIRKVKTLEIEDCLDWVRYVWSYMACLGVSCGS